MSGEGFVEDEAAAGSSRKDPRDMETLAGSVGEVETELKLTTPAEGTYLPIALVERQVVLAGRSSTDLTRLLADVVVACALRMKAETPRAMLDRLARDYKISDESWWQKVRPELLRVLSDRGIDTSGWGE